MNRRLKRRLRRLGRAAATPAVPYRPAHAARRGILGRSLYVLGHIPQGMVLFMLIAAVGLLSWGLMQF